MLKRHVLGAVLAWTLMGPASAADPVALGLAGGSPLMRWDPSVRYGVLPNGLRFALQHTDGAKGAVSVRLGIRVGSYDESDDERGAAHLVEHLAFEATKSFADRPAALTLAAVRMAFGPDRNAVSDLVQTTFEIDLPTPDSQVLDTAQTWLRDVADGLNFTEPMVGRARAAIEAERSARNARALQLRERVSAFEDAGLRSADRPVLGTPQAMATLTPSRLKGFYDRWYRPENAVVVVVGDLPLDAMETQVRGRFGDWRATGPVSVRAATGIPPGGDGLEVKLEPTASGDPVARICRIAAPDGDAAAPERLRALLRREVWRARLQRRLNVLGTRADAPFSQTNVSTDVRPDSLKTCIAIAVAKGGELRALRLVQGEVRRFVDEGPGEVEIERALEQLRGLIRGAIGVAPRPPGQASEILQRVFDGMPQLEPREGLRAFDILLEDLRPAQVQSDFLRDWSGRGPLVTIAGPAAIAEADVRAAMDAASPSAPTTTKTVAAPGGGLQLPANDQAQFERAERALVDGRPKDAWRVFDDIARRQPRACQAVAGRARAFVLESKFDRALSDFGKALELCPGDGVALNARGNLFLALRQPERALADFNTALEANPADAIVLYNRGLALKEVNRSDAAVRDFNAVLRATPGDPLTLLGKAEAYRQLGDLLLAREFYDAVLAGDPANAIAKQGRADVTSATGPRQN